MSETDTRIRKITPRQNKALAALLEGANQEEAAAAAKVTPRTLKRWLETNVLFYEELRSRKSMVINRAGVRLAGTLDMAVDVFREIMQDEEAPAGVRLRAANIAASHALRVLELSDIVTRLDELEAKVTANNAQRSY